MSPARARSRGYLLIELGIVVVILLLVAAASLARGESHRATAAEIAGERFARALRHARAEAVRSGVPHGVEVEAEGDAFRVFRLDGDDFVTTIDPLGHRTARYAAGDPGIAAGIHFDTTAGFRYSSGTRLDAVVFDVNGEPCRPQALASGRDPLLTGVVTVTLGDNRSEVVLDSPSGRVRRP